jgi:hypothetical protein
MSNLKDNKTTVSGFTGNVVERTSHPTDEGVSGLSHGEVYVNVTTKQEFIYDKESNKFWGKAFTTTSTSSTSTSTTTS